MRNPISLPGWPASTATADGTVRWGLRAGVPAWPDRSAPAPAVRELSFKGVGFSLASIRSLAVAFLPRFRCFGRSDRILQRLIRWAEMLETGERRELPSLGNEFGYASFTV